MNAPAEAAGSPTAERFVRVVALAAGLVFVVGGVWAFVAAIVRARATGG